jgi:beta-glucosidase
VIVTPALRCVAVAPRDVPFERDFLWGTATSAYQIEGGASNTDWWRFEHQAGSPVAEPCGDACDSWRRYEEDLDLVASLGLNAYRFSLEWSRIEPSRGEVDQGALAHYRRVLEGCRARGLAPVVTLHHFTLPRWVADEGGFESPTIVARMAEYAGVVGAALGDLIAVACTINEPNIVAAMGYLAAMFPPGVSDRSRYVAVNETLRECHRAMTRALRAGPGSFPIGLTLSMAQYEAVEGGEAALEDFRREMEDGYLREIDDDDFLGVQCYTKHLVGPDGLIWGGDGELTDMGYLFWPEVVGHTLRRAARWTSRPLVVTENGIGTTDEAQRVRYLAAALHSLDEARREGVDVRGYFQWSLLDNFEWVLGYGPRFGLVAVDRTTFARTPKPSAAWYAEAVREARHRWA